jgi:predicted DNA-binding transcriptional regulator AlpA
MNTGDRVLIRGYKASAAPRFGGVTVCIRDAKASNYSIELNHGDVATCREFPLGMKEIAALLGVRQDTVWQWEKNGKLPPEDGDLSGRKGWWRETILTWDAAGRPRRSQAELNGHRRNEP